MCNISVSDEFSKLTGKCLKDGLYVIVETNNINPISGNVYLLDDNLQTIQCIKSHPARYSSNCCHILNQYLIIERYIAFTHYHITQISDINKTFINCSNTLKYSEKFICISEKYGVFDIYNVNLNKVTHILNDKFKEPSIIFDYGSNIMVLYENNNIMVLDLITLKQIEFQTTSKSMIESTVVFEPEKSLVYISGHRIHNILIRSENGKSYESNLFDYIDVVSCNENILGFNWHNCFILNKYCQIIKTIDFDSETYDHHLFVGSKFFIEGLFCYNARICWYDGNITQICKESGEYPEKIVPNNSENKVIVEDCMHNMTVYNLSTNPIKSCKYLQFPHDNIESIYWSKNDHKFFIIYEDSQNKIKRNIISFDGLHY